MQRTKKHNGKAGTRHICLLGASFATRNLGVSVLSDGAIGFLFKAFPEVSICLVDYSRRKDVYTGSWEGQAVMVDTVPVRFSKNILLRNNIGVLFIMALLLRFLGKGKLRAMVLRAFPALGTLAASKINCGISGGDSFSDIYGMRRFLYVSLPMIVAQLTGVPFVMLPQTYGPFQSRLSRIIARHILRKSALVFTRDTDGQSKLDELFDRGYSVPQARFCPDVAFAVEPRPVDHGRMPGLLDGRRGRKVIAGLNVSGLLYIGGYSGENMFGLRDEYPEVVQQVARALLSSGADRVMLIPHVRGGREHAESDTTASYKLASRLRETGTDNIEIVEGIEEHRELKFIIGRCDLFVGSRMHSCIAALSQGVPTIGLAYSDKFHGVLESAGAGDWVVDLRTTDARASAGAVAKGMKSRKKMAERLSKTRGRIDSSLVHSAHELRKI